MERVNINIIRCSELKDLLVKNPNYEKELFEAAEKSKNYQRKILPWEQIEDTYEELKAKQIKRKRKDIILVASLIEKVPNLGGLCRTCEIFNVSALAIPSIKIMDVQLHIYQSVRITFSKACQLAVRNGSQFMKFLKKIWRNI